jgi:UDP-N-acetylglucosamine 3-dehydrogenase
LDEMKKLGLAVIGTGFWGRNHVRILNSIKDAKVVGICDTDLKRAKQVGTRYEIEYCRNLDEILSRRDVNAVTICTPTTTHKDVADKAIEAGKDVFIEKPLASTSQEARKLLSFAKRRRVRVAVGFVERYNPAVGYIKKLIDKKELGKIILITARRVTRWPIRIGDVGVTKDSAIHDIDVMRYLVGGNVKTVYARVGRLVHRFEDFSEMLLNFSGGEVGFIDANWLTPRKIRKLTITGSEATATIDYVTQETVIEDSKRSIVPRIKFEEPLRLELKNFVQSILSGKQPSASGEDGLKALEVCEAALKSGATGQVVHVSS